MNNPKLQELSVKLDALACEMQDLPSDSSMKSFMSDYNKLEEKLGDIATKVQTLVDEDFELLKVSDDEEEQP